MKRRFAKIVLVLTVPILLLASSNVLLGKIKPLFEIIHNLYGDTYRMCNLKKYKQRLSIPAVCKTADKQKKVHLYLVGDSYSWRISPTCFNAENYSNGSWMQPLPEVADTSEINVLVLESTERLLRERLQDIRHFLYNRKYHEVHGRTRKPEDYITFNAEDNLQSIIFLDPVSLFFREQKASINLHWFGRIDEHVFISGNGQQLYIKETIDSTLLTSSFKYLPQDELDTMVLHLNALQQLAKQSGYDEVRLSVIPNKVTVMDSIYKGMHYNQLIPRLERHPALQVSLLPVLSWITPSDYYIGDTHWNQQGCDKWTSRVNHILKEASESAR